MPFTLTNRMIRLADSGQLVGTGWLPPMLDPRDFTPSHPAVQPLLEKLSRKRKEHGPKRLKQARPAAVDLRPWCSPVEQQGQIGSCTAHAAAGIVEYYERRASGKHVEASRLFLYKTTRNLIGVQGDTGAWLRNTMGAMVTCGVAPEQYWRYTDQKPDFDREPTPFVYSIADNFEAVKYFAHDPLGRQVSGKQTLESVIEHLAAGVPSMFGFWGYPSISANERPGEIPLPTDEELAGDPSWGHAVAAVGYDDQREIVNQISRVKTKGALLFRNSWGPEWGEGGYGWMPYDYVLRGTAMDFWSMISMKWVDLEQFHLPGEAPIA